MEALPITERLRYMDERIHRKRQKSWLCGAKLTSDEARDLSLVILIARNELNLLDEANRLLQPLLISAGLVCGITPTSVRRQCGASIPDFVSSRPDGDDADAPSQDS